MPPTTRFHPNFMFFYSLGELICSNLAEMHFDVRGAQNHHQIPKETNYKTIDYRSQKMLEQTVMPRNEKHARDGGRRAHHSYCNPILLYNINIYV